MASQTKSKISTPSIRARWSITSRRSAIPRGCTCARTTAPAPADFEIDKADRDAGNKITIPMMALWGDAGIASAAATPLDTWKNWATNVRERRSIVAIF
jgi:haloacetate dehalogenase